ncbi:MAG: glycosyltransferase family 1 protein, partial [Alphaproteobacteria bacterium]|nr:glycosyltransferase family 1 protein [Alphaproteobacteria bacterium]
ALADRRGRLVAFVGNELNSPLAPLGAKIAWLRRVRPDIVATQLLQEAGDWLYADVKAAVGAQVLSLPHALNPRAFRPGPPARERPIDLGARAAPYPPWIGDDDRRRIHDLFAANAFDPPLAVDLSQDERLDRADWAAFLARCRATVGTEAGSWWLERDDATALAVHAFLKARRKPGLVLPHGPRLHRLAQRIPFGVKALAKRMLRSGPLRHEALEDPAVPFAEIVARFFAGKPRPPVYAKAIASRHLDAVGARTLQVLFPGRYCDVLTAGQHYVALSPDLSNLAEVEAILRDPDACDRITEAALAHVLDRHTHAHRIAALLQALDSLGARDRAAG